MAAQKHHGIDYIEFVATDLPAIKAFYSEVFGWDFVDYGPDYAAMTPESAGLDGGFTKERSPSAPGVLPVLYSDDLDATLAAVKGHGGDIVREIFEFPGGRRFHFRDPAGNEVAVWSVPV